MHPGLGLWPASLQRLRREVGRNVLIEECDLVVVGPARFVVVPGVPPVVRRRLPRTGDHGSDQDQQVRGGAIANEGGRERTERLGDHDQIRPVADRPDHGVRVLGQAGRVVLARKVRRHDVVTSGPQFGLHQVPVPADVAGAVDQDVRGHRHPLQVRFDAQPMTVRLHAAPVSLRSTGSMRRSMRTRRRSLAFVLSFLDACRVHAGTGHRARRRDERAPRCPHRRPARELPPRAASSARYARSPTCSCNGRGAATGATDPATSNCSRRSRTSSATAASRTPGRGTTSPTSRCSGTDRDTSARRARSIAA